MLSLWGSWIHLFILKTKTVYCSPKTRETETLFILFGLISSARSLNSESLLLVWSLVTKVSLCDPVAFLRLCSAPYQWVCFHCRGPKSLTCICYGYLKYINALKLKIMHISSSWNGVLLIEKVIFFLSSFFIKLFKFIIIHYYIIYNIATFFLRLSV